MSKKPTWVKKYVCVGKTLNPEVLQVMVKNLVFILGENAHYLKQQTKESIFAECVKGPKQSGVVYLRTDLHNKMIYRPYSFKNIVKSLGRMMMRYFYLPFKAFLNDHVTHS